MNRALIVTIIGLFVALSCTYVQKASVERKFAEYRISVAQEREQAQAKQLAKQQQLQFETERIAHDAEKNRQIFVARVARAESAAGGLRDEITRLNARPAPSNPESAAFADEARLARELLGTCSEEYRGMALEADGLRDQVSGLHAYIQKVVQSGK